MATRILIADDHDIVRKGLKTFIELDPELEVVGLARDGKEAVELARQLKPDVVLMDLLMPVMDGIAATEAVMLDEPGTAVLMLTSALEQDSVSRAIRAGARGYILK